MSNRPMRLKYLTKMKIILCIFLLCITAVSVFGQSVELNGIVGKSIEFPAAVKIDGSWMYSGVTIGVMISGRFTPPHNGGYRDRVQWDSSTGLLSLSALRKNDSGEYKVENTQQKINTAFQLNVYEDNVPVLKPHVSVTHDEYPCTLLCAAARGTGVTLTLYREGEKNPYVTSPVRSDPHLDMTETVESGTYTCEAKNSVSRETSDPLPVGAHCTAPSSHSTGTKVAIGIAVVAIFIAVVALFIAVVFAVKYRRITRELQNELAVLRDDIRKLPQDEANQRLIKDVFSRAIRDKQPLIKDVWTFLYYPEAWKTMTSSPPTGVPLIQATCEVGIGTFSSTHVHKSISKKQNIFQDSLGTSWRKTLNRNDEPEDETPRTGSYTINPQPCFPDDL